MSNASDFVIENGVFEQGVLKKYVGPGGDVVIPEHVERIRGLAFSMCKEISSVVIPGSVKSIGVEAFFYCPKLVSVDIQEGVEILEKNVFRACDNLERVSLPKSITSIGKGALWKVKRVKLQHWPKGMTQAIDPDALQEIDIEDFTKVPAGFRIFAFRALLGEKDSETRMRREEKWDAYLRKNAGKLCEEAMRYPELLQYMCARKLIPAKDVDAYLAAAEKIEGTEAKAALLQYQDVLGQAALEKARTKKEKEGEANTDRLAERLGKRDPSKGIEGLRFAIPTVPFWWKNRKHLKEHLEQYGAKLSTTVGKTTDYLVLGEKEEVPEDAKNLGVPILSPAAFNEMVGEHFQNAEVITVPEWLKELPGCAFTACTKLVKVELPFGLVSINDGAFNRNGKLEKIEIPETVTTIGTAFQHCESLLHLVIPEGVVTIGDDAFQNCTSLEYLQLPMSLREIGNGTFSGCPSLTIHAPAGSYAEQYAKEHNIPFVAE